jgi:hypothetical protein
MNSKPRPGGEPGKSKPTHQRVPFSKRERKFLEKRGSVDDSLDAHFGTKSFRGRIDFESTIAKQKK